MYKYCANVDIVDAIDIIDEYMFQVAIRGNMTFKIADCYFKVKKNYDYRFNISDSLEVSYYTENKNQKEAKKIIKKAIELFIYITEIPFDINFGITECIDNNLPNIDVNLSKKKMNQIDEINQQYNRINGKKALMCSVLHMYGKRSIT